jgi:hypothetical protein
VERRGVEGADLVGWPEGQLTTVGVEQQHDIGDRQHSLEPVLDDDHGVVACVRDTCEQLEQCLHAGRIEVRGRLVEDEQVRFVRKHAGDREALLLAARQRRRRAAFEPGEADQPQRVGDTLLHHVARPATVLEAERDLVGDARHHEL